MNYRVKPGNDADKVVPALPASLCMSCRDLIPASNPLLRLIERPMGPGIKSRDDTLICGNRQRTYPRPPRLP